MRKIQDEMMEETGKSRSKHLRNSMAVIGVQSAACAVLLLLFLLFKWMGGDGYTRLQDGVRDALEQHTLIETFLGALPSREPDQEYTYPTDNITDNTTASVSTVTTQTTPSTQTTAPTDG